MISTQRAILVHGFNTTPNGAWFPWLMAELKKLAVFAVSLDMPTPATPVRDEWIAEIAHAVDRHQGQEVYLVGHSLGVATILDYLQSPVAHKIKGAVLVSGRIHPSENLKTAGFYQQFDFKKIRSMCDGIVVIHAKNDDIVKYEEAVELSAGLSVELVSLETGGHLSGSQGVYELPEALNALKKLGVHSERKS